MYPERTCDRIVRTVEELWKLSLSDFDYILANRGNPYAAMRGEGELRSVGGACYQSEFSRTGGGRTVGRRFLPMHQGRQWGGGVLFHCPCGFFLPS